MSQREEMRRAAADSQELVKLIGKQLGDDLAQVCRTKLSTRELQMLAVALDDMANRCIQLGVRSVKLLVETERMAQGGGS